MVVLLCALGAAFAVPATAGAAPTPAAVARVAEEPLTVVLDGSGSVADPGRTIVDYRWDFGDGQTGTGAVVSHRFPAAGGFTATLTVTDDAGASASSQLAVAVQAVTLALSETSVVWGEQIAASGGVEPATAGLEILIELGSGGAWVELGRATTDSAGRYGLLVAPEAGGLLRGRLAATGAVGESLAVRVAPKVVFETGRPGVAFVGARLGARVYPASYAGTALVTVMRRGKAVTSVSVPVRAGRLRTLVPLPGIGRFSVVVRLGAASGLSERRVVTEVRSLAPARLELGSKGVEVRGLARRLGLLGFRLPPVRSILGPALQDAVIAFQKSAGLEPTCVVTERVWRALAGARPLAARYRSPALHLELDAELGLLVVVRAGQVAGAISVSATGSTRRGVYSVLSKAPFKTTWAGYVKVPSWAAAWLGAQSRVGERLYVYS